MSDSNLHYGALETSVLQQLCKHQMLCSLYPELLPGHIINKTKGCKGSAAKYKTLLEVEYAIVYTGVQD